MPKARLASSRRTAMATRAARRKPPGNRADALHRIAVLKATRPPGWVKSARALCDKLADLDDLDGARPEADQPEPEEDRTP